MSLASRGAAVDDDEDYGLNDDFDDDDLEAITLVEQQILLSQIDAQKYNSQQKYTSQSQAQTASRSRTLSEVVVERDAVPRALDEFEVEGYEQGAGGEQSASASLRRMMSRSDSRVQETTQAEETMHALRTQIAQQQKALVEVTAALQTAKGEIFILRDQQQRATAEHGKYVFDRNQMLKETTESFQAKEEEFSRAIESLNNEKLFMQQDLTEMRTKIRTMEKAQQRRDPSSASTAAVQDGRLTPSPKKKRDQFREGFDVQVSPLKNKKRKVQDQREESLYDGSSDVVMKEVTVVKEVFIEDKFQFTSGLFNLDVDGSKAMDLLGQFSLQANGNTDFRSHIAIITAAINQPQPSLLSLIENLIQCLVEAMMTCAKRPESIPSLRVLISILEYTATYNIRGLRIGTLQRIAVSSQELYLLLEPKNSLDPAREAECRRTQLLLLRLLDTTSIKIDSREEIVFDQMIAGMWMSVSHEIVVRILTDQYFNGQDILLSCLRHSVIPSSFGPLVEDVERQNEQELELCKVISLILVEPPQPYPSPASADEDPDERAIENESARERLIEQVVTTLEAISATEHGRTIMLQSKAVLARLICCCSAVLDQMYRSETLDRVRSRSNLASSMIKLTYRIVFGTDLQDPDESTVDVRELSTSSSVFSKVFGEFGVRQELVVCLSRVAFADEGVVFHNNFDEITVACAERLLEIGRDVEEMNVLYLSVRGGESREES
ncbi:hypothetical protein BZA70DRAFT_72094 [Myxozyma melibiosi]|uniref:Rad26-like helical repeats domain-containing protein n=1 Tax=Myxozyma melibiosi TaxID=54550 RepID=A0ABR1F1I2_9ASCO